MADMAMLGKPKSLATKAEQALQMLPEVHSFMQDAQDLHVATTSATEEHHVLVAGIWDAKIYAAQTKQTMGEVVTLALQRLIDEDAE